MRIAHTIAIGLLIEKIKGDISNISCSFFHSHHSEDKSTYTVFTCPVRRPVIRTLQLHLTTPIQLDQRERLLKEQMGEHYKAIIEEDGKANMVLMLNFSFVHEFFIRRDVIFSLK